MALAPLARLFYAPQPIPGLSVRHLEAFARLWDNSNPSAPQDLGLYYFSLEVRFDIVSPAG